MENQKELKIMGKICPYCNSEFYKGSRWSVKFCSESCRKKDWRKNHKEFYKELNRKYSLKSKESGQRKAISLVQNAILTGKMLHPSYHVCFDCGKTAECYEHRDYNKPLNVEPVCRGCNVRRGKAKYICT